MANIERYQFRGFWSEAEKGDCGGEPWELFTIVLFGDEAGDSAGPDDKEFRQILDASGYEIILRKKEQEEHRPQ